VLEEIDASKFGDCWTAEFLKAKNFHVSVGAVVMGHVVLKVLSDEVVVLLKVREKIEEMWSCG